VELPVDDNQTIKVEVTSQAQGVVQAGTGEKLAEAAERLDEAVGRVVKLGRQVIEKARAAGEPPTRIEVELGLKLTVKTGFVIAESSGEGHFRVTLEWSTPG
jgi:hypothetical protein